MVELNLNFDAMEEDTQLAKEYLKEKQTESVTDVNNIEAAKDILANTPPVQYLNYKLAFKYLAQKLKENAALFSQLELCLRKIPKHEVVQFDISLLVQNFLFWSSNTNFKCPSEADVVTVGSNSPLATLGLVAPQLLNKGRAVVRAVDSTVAVCCLFSNLCGEVGLHSVKIVLNTTDCTGDAVKGQDGSVAYCAGVITQRSDLDSAVDAFLASPTKYPWTIRRIWVQESVYQSFKDALAWKCNIRSSNVTVEPHLNSLCSEVFGYDQKMFLIDFVGNPDAYNAKSYLPVMVEAFRTTKELFSLLKQHSPLAVSVWSSDVSEANEIAFGLSSHLVWVNDYGYFTGHPRASQGFYSSFSKNTSRAIDNKALPEKALQLRNAWCKRSVVDRAKILTQALIAFKKLNLKGEESIIDFKKLEEAVIDKEVVQYVEVENRRICVVTEEPAGAVFVDDITRCDADLLIDLFVSIVRGNALVYTCSSTTHIYYDLFRVLEESHALPVVRLDGPRVFATSTAAAYLYRTKAVWTNYGTTFAN